jgi:hypothetical protein
MRVEDPRELGEQRRVVRVTGGGHVGRGQQARREPIEVEVLVIVEAKVFEGSAEEGPEALAREPAVADLEIVGAEAQEQILVAFEKGRTAGPPRVPDQRDPAAGREDPFELGAGARDVEPVEASSIDAGDRPVRSALPATEWNPGVPPSVASAASRIAAFGSTAKTSKPRSTKGALESPVPEPRSAIRPPAGSPVEARMAS